MTLRYRVRLERIGERLIDVSLTLPPAAVPYRLAIPAWIPGSYMIRDFARHVVQVEAFRPDGRPHALTWEDKQTWVLPASDEPVRLRWAVHANDLSVRGAHFDAEHAFFNGTSLFPLWMGHEGTPCELELLAPSDEGRAQWRVATGMPSVDIDEYGFGLYRAENYEALIDYPFEVGNFRLLEFEAGGIPHRMAFTGAHPEADLARVARDVARICTAQLTFFGDPPPFDGYLFLVDVEVDAYGGLEHRNSTALVCSQASLPRRGETEPPDAYRQFLGLCSHEYFHSWNVKRIRPQAFMGLPLANEAYTRLLWVFEGVTSYYDDLFLRRAGLVDDAGYLELLAGTLNRVFRGQGHRCQTLEESSLLAWTKFYKQDENAINALASYYNKGALVALMLDLILRTGPGHGSLDALMRLLWREYGQTGRGLPEGETVERLAERVGGLKLDEFFAQALRTTDELPVVETLSGFGVSARWVPEKEGPDFGVIIRADERGEARVAAVHAGRPAASAGVCAEDVIIAVDGERVDAASLPAVLARSVARRPVTWTVFRRRRLREIQVVPADPPANQLRLGPDPAASPEAVARLRTWLD
ncbi:MAG: M61 family metallopeptidase [Halothiobacillaceae bacterium]